MEDKDARQRTLVELIKIHRMESQAEVVRELCQCGYAATQSSVSRDFRELGIVKIAGCYRQIDNMKNLGELGNASGFVRRCEEVGENLLVVHTSAGAAHVVAGAIDETRIPGVMGTVAGDDTIFVATADGVAQGSLKKSLLVNFYS